jgi:hypothetical protein
VQAAGVVFRSEPGKRYAGEVARLGREADRETREFVVDVRVKELPENWTIGQRAEVFIETGRRTGVMVMPATFVRWREKEAWVFVNDRGRARWRGMTLGLRGCRRWRSRRAFRRRAIVRRWRAEGLNDGQRSARNELAVRDIRHNLGRFP